MPGERGTVRYGRPEQEPDPRDRAQLPRAPALVLPVPAGGAGAEPAAGRDRAGRHRRAARARRRPRHGAAARRSGRPADRGGARRQPAGSGPHPPARGLAVADRRPHRLSRAQRLQGDDRSGLADRHAAEALGGRARLLRALRLVARPRHRPGARPRAGDGLDRRERRGADRDHAGDARLGQRRRPDLPPDDRGRSELHAHRHPVGRERHRRGGAARALRHHRPARDAARPEELLHPARGGDPRRRRHADRDRLFRHDRLGGRRRRGRRRRARRGGRERLDRLHRPLLDVDADRPAGAGLHRRLEVHRRDRHLPDRHAPAGAGGGRPAPPPRPRPGCSRAPRSGRCSGTTRTRRRSTASSTPSTGAGSSS